jgi:hypothetical protein
MRIAALEEPDAVKVLGGRAAHVHRVFGEINVAIGRDAQGGRRLNIGSFEDDFALKAVGHFGQRFGGGEGEDAKRREEREKAGCHGGNFYGRREGGRSNRYDNRRAGQRLDKGARFDLRGLIG